MRNLCIPLFGALVPAQGGHFGAILRGAAADGSEDYALIVAEASAEIEDATWADEYKTIEGADSKTDGPANTAAMAAAGLALAQRIKALDLGGHTDWYLPAAAELRALSATVPELFHQKDWYWSSSQYSRSYAWCQDFECGSSNALFKDNEFRARPVRRVQLQALNT
ncbi:DUF1566 domain-containing protein [Acidovorax sp. ACV01]|uniref:Lcl C-terminal domain-containing protein n=1 Tax=Acidovorax sp. ACV01 TaxID=2769311 RepID=UPI00177FE8F8|nr:DUF1566 domain-containing protein [Acidovorax sp. ACV01]MBD9395173.1 DUF1566 domain-containing protein [Acidovorax sp. ACV01]